MTFHPQPVVRLSHTLDDEWLREPAVVCGPVPTGGGTPQCFVTVTSDGERLLRVDVYAAREGYCFREDALILGQTLFVGVDHHVFVLDLPQTEVSQHELDSYFGYFFPLVSMVSWCAMCATASSSGRPN